MTALAKRRFAWSRVEAAQALAHRQPTSCSGTLTTFIAMHRATDLPAALVPDEEWERRRSPPKANDTHLTALTRAWEHKLPDTVRLANLCATYPRIANRIALCWNDPALTAKLFQELMTDRRGLRKGFPAAVRAELVALRQLNQRRVRPELASRDDGWDSRFQALSDR